MKRPDHHYSGPNSSVFWERVSVLPRQQHAVMYAAGVLLQNMEESVLHWLAAEEARVTPKRRKKR